MCVYNVYNVKNVCIMCRCRVGENWWYRGQHCEEYVSEPLVVAIAMVSVVGFLLVGSGVLFFLVRTLRDQYQSDDSEDPLRYLSHCLITSCLTTLLPVLLPRYQSICLTFLLPVYLSHYLITCLLGMGRFMKTVRTVRFDCLGSIRVCCVRFTRGSFFSEAKRVHFTAAGGATAPKANHQR